MNVLNLKIKPLQLVFTTLLLLIASIAYSQTSNINHEANNNLENTYSCNNESYTFLKQTIGKWHVITKDRTSPNVYENNHGTSTITNSIEGCGIKESYIGIYKNKPYAREVVVNGLDSTSVQMMTLDSEHGSFSISDGSINNKMMTTYWYRNKDVKRLQSKYILTFKSDDIFEFSSYLSTDSGKSWALTHERKYSKIEHTEISFITSDSITVYGDSYTINKKLPTILLCHQGGSNSRGEYINTIPKLLNEGYNIIAIDQRVGGSSYYGNYNRTVANSDKKDFAYCEAYPDIEGALDYTISNNYNGKIILWGSSYSAALALQLASKHSHDIDAVLAFSPSTGSSVNNCHPNLYLEKVTQPLLLLRPKREMERESSIAQFELANKNGHKTYIAENGVHASSMLVKERVQADVSENWKVVLEFLKTHTTSLNINIPYTKNATDNISANGVFDEQQWQNAIKKPITESLDLLLLQSDDNIYIGIKSHSETIKTSSDIFIENDLNEKLNLHASMKIGERNFSKKSWDPKINPFTWGNNKLWTANITKWDEKKKDQKLAMVYKFEYMEGQEFIISKEKLRSKAFNLRLKINVINKLDKVKTVEYPSANASLKPSYWLNIKL